MISCDILAIVSSLTFSSNYAYLREFDYFFLHFLYIQVKLTCLLFQSFLFALFYERYENFAICNLQV